MAGRHAAAAGVGRTSWWTWFVAWVASLHVALGRGEGDGAGLGAGASAQAQARWLAITAVALPLSGVLVAGPAVGAVVVVMLLAGGWWVARGADARRSAAVDAELPMLLEGIARRLRAGGSLAEAMAAQVRAGAVGSHPAEASALDGACGVGSQPTQADGRRVGSQLARVDGRGVGSQSAEAWARVVADVPTFGVVGALDAWVAHNPRPSVRLAAAALALAAETGGSPARAVDGVAATLRARASVAREVRALTSQARASAVVIAFAPVAFALLAGATDARTRAAYRTSVGTVLVVAGLALDVIGGWWMARLCRLRVAT